MESCGSLPVLHTRRTAVVSAVYNYRLATVSTSFWRLSEVLGSVSLSPHGSFSRGIKRLWRLDYLGFLGGSLALEVGQSLLHVGSELLPADNPRPQQTLSTPSRWRSSHLLRSFRKPAESECHLTPTNFRCHGHVVGSGMHFAGPVQRSRCRSASILIVSKWSREQNPITLQIRMLRWTQASPASGHRRLPLMPQHWLIA